MLLKRKAERDREREDGKERVVSEEGKERESDVREEGRECNVGEDGKEWKMTKKKEMYK